MLRHFAHDTGSQFALLSMLLTKGIASRVMTCSRWSQWINEPNVLGPRHRGVKPSRFSELMRCEWIRRPQRECQLLLESDEWPAEEDYDRLMAVEQQQLEDALGHLGPPHFPILEDLCIHTRVARISESVLRDCLQSLGSRLKDLDCVIRTNVNGPDAHRSAIVESLTLHVGSLPKLCRLSIDAPMLLPECMPFDALPPCCSSISSISVRSTARTLRWCGDLRSSKSPVWPEPQAH